MDASRYRVVRRIGVGGMAEVLEAIAIGAAGFERRVALKRMLPHDGDAAREHRMFLDEARIASYLHHANIVAVLDFGLADGRPFQVLEYVDGVDVRALLERGPLPIPLALHIALAVGHALDHAHRATDGDGAPLGIVHRDVTPANILVSRGGDVKLTDFGIAFAHAKSEQTLAGTTKGTPWFMSPEQMMGGPTDGRADVFSLGCVLHTMLTGASPLERKSQQIDAASGAEVDLDRALPADVRAIIERATRHAPSDRHASARELVAALAEVTTRYPVADPRTALREWIAGPSGGAEPAAAPRAGKLDALLDLALILDASGSRAFATVSPPPAPAPAPAPATLDLPVTRDLAPPLAPTGVHLPPPPPRSRLVLVGLLAGVALVVGGGAFLVARWLAAPAPPAPPPGPSEVAVVVDAMSIDAPVIHDAAPVVPTAIPDAPPAKRVPPAPRPPAAPSPATVRWMEKHPRAAGTFAAWVQASPDAARALRAWEGRSGQGNRLLTWLVMNPGTSPADYAAAYPDSGLDAVVAKHGAALRGVGAWIRLHGRLTANLARQGGGLPWP